jgi:Lipid A 3-O-deacylase (PagL)
MKYLLLGLLALATPVQADKIRVFGQWGVSPGHPSTKGPSSCKWAEIGLTGAIGKFVYTHGIGGWDDRSGYSDRKVNQSPQYVKSSLFVESLLGVEPHTDHYYISYKLGPSYIAHSDILLGSNLQVGHELGLGVKDVRGVRIGIVIKHFSNAGLKVPNTGRDFAGIRIEF